AASGIISYQPARRTRGVRMLDEQPVKQLRIRPQEIARRAALEQRKLREMINFCYTDSCYRAFILDYFGDPHHAQTCGMCGNCNPQMKGSDAHAQNPSPPIDPPTELDRFVREQVPFAIDLEEDLGENARMRRVREKAEAATNSHEV